MLRFMPVGDSQTIGSAGEHTWRYRMWQHLCATYDGPFTLVGPRETLYDPRTDAPTSYAYAEPDFPRAHLAGWGEGWLHMAPLVEDAVRRGRADVLLVALGLIDLGFYTDPEQTADNVRAFVAAARRADPHVRMVVLPVVPNVRAASDASFGDQVTAFNELLAKTLADLDEPGSPLLLASLPASYDLHTDTYDGTHPNASGEHKLAAAFADALHQAWGLGAPYAG
ncbi:GDSL-type esterase/lipase family protein [Streptomyces galbus]|uniref:GDSL-type esterase/lipase family protein n=1 Tax=Streptomyces galbus TaxID=33898 RepID=UPI0037A33A48